MNHYQALRELHAMCLMTPQEERALEYLGTTDEEKREDFNTLIRYIHRMLAAAEVADKAAAEELLQHVQGGSNMDRELKQEDENIKIYVLDEKGAGGAHHYYQIITAPQDKLQQQYEVIGVVRFQNGPIQEKGVNGVTNEALLELVKHRLECFQDGPFACDHNAHALAHTRAALQSLYGRTRDRKKRGVEGKSEV